MRRQIQLRREQERRFKRTNDPTLADVLPSTNETVAVEEAPFFGGNVRAKEIKIYLCQKCNNHSEINYKKVGARRVRIVRLLILSVFLV